MTHILNSITINKPVDMVFKVFTDPKTASKWIKGLISIEQITPGKIGVGTKFLQKHKDGSEFMEETLAFDPPNRTAFKIDHKMILSVVDCVFIDKGDSTEINIKSEITMRAISFKLFRFFLVRMIRKKLQADLERFKALAES